MHAHAHFVRLDETRDRLLAVRTPRGYKKQRANLAKSKMKRNMIYDPLNYEWQTVKHLKLTHELSYHWSEVPEEDYLRSGWIVDQGAQRRERLKDGGYRD